MVYINMDSYLYKRKSDGKVFLIKRSYDVFVGVLNWYEGPQYEKEYVLTTVVEGEEEEVITRDLLTDYDKTNKLTSC
jgi:hypothetical protein